MDNLTTDAQVMTPGYTLVIDSALSVPSAMMKLFESVVSIVNERAVMSGT